MMRRDFVILGGAILLLFVVLAVKLLSDRSRVDIVRSGEKLLAGVDVEAIEKIIIRQGDVKTTLLRTPGGYNVEERNSYAGDTAKIDELLVRLLNMKGTEWITSNERKFEKLGVSDSNSEAVNVSFLAAGDKALGGLILGDYRKLGKEQQRLARATSRYVRATGTEDVFLVLDVNRIDPYPAEWLESKLLEIPRKDIDTVELKHPGRREDFIIKNVGEGEFELAGVKTGNGGKAKEYLVESVAEAMSSLRLKDVMPADGAEAKDLSFDHRYTARLKDGRKYEIETAEKEGKKWLKINVSYEPAKEEETGEDPEELSKRHKKRFEGWLFEVYDHDDFRRKMSDLF